MKRIAVLAGVIGLLVLISLVWVDPAAARNPVVGDGTGPNGGVLGGRWYSGGTVTQTVWFESYECVWNPWPYPGQYEYKVVRRAQTIFYLREVCSFDPRISECTPGAERLTFQCAWG
jgi:hypothetical protein